MVNVLSLIRSFFCSHPDSLRKSDSAGTFYLECMTCGHCTPGVPTGPGWHLVKGDTE